MESIELLNPLSMAEPPLDPPDEYWGVEEEQPEESLETRISIWEENQEYKERMRNPGW